MCNISKRTPPTQITVRKMIFEQSFPADEEQVFVRLQHDSEEIIRISRRKKTPQVENKV